MQGISEGKIKNKKHILKRGNKHQSVKTDKARILKLSDQRLKKTMIIILRALMEDINSTQEQMSNVSKEGKSKEREKEMLEVRSRCNRNEEGL